VRAGENATYVLSFRNNGPSAAQAVSVSDAIAFAPGDAGLTVISLASSKGGSTCSLGAGAQLPGPSEGAVDENAFGERAGGLADVVLLQADAEPRGLQLPGLDGLELTRRLKADPATRDIKIIAVTAYAMKGDQEKALAAGCDAYVPKPIDTRGFPDLNPALGSPEVRLQDHPRWNGHPMAHAALATHDLSVAEPVQEPADRDARIPGVASADLVLDRARGRTEPGVGE